MVMNIDSSESVHVGGLGQEWTETVSDSPNTLGTLFSKSGFAPASWGLRVSSVEIPNTKFKKYCFYVLRYFISSDTLLTLGSCY